MYIAIEGNIGAGKSTLSKKLAEKIGACLVLEVFEDHPQLKDFYDGKEVNQFEMEKWFLESRFDMLLKAQKKCENIISDFWFEKSMIFANINLIEKDKMNFAKNYYDLQVKIKQPDVIIYIDSESGELEKSIKKRDRDLEKNISSDYLLNISTAYKKRMSGLKNVKIIYLNMHEIRSKDMNDVISDIFKIMRRNE